MSGLGAGWVTRDDAAAGVLVQREAERFQAKLLEVMALEGPCYLVVAEDDTLTMVAESWEVSVGPRRQAWPMPTAEELELGRAQARAVAELDPNACMRCGRDTYQPADVGGGKRPARRCSGCHHVPGRCSCVRVRGT